MCDRTKNKKARKFSFAGIRILWLPDLESNQEPVVSNSMQNFPD